MSFTEAVEQLSFLTMNTFFKVKQPFVQIHPSIHTRANGNPIALADDVSRRLRSAHLIDRGGLTFDITDEKTLMLYFKNIRMYEADAKDDDPDITVVGDTSPWLTPSKYLCDLLDPASSWQYLVDYLKILMKAQPISNSYSSDYYLPFAYVCLAPDKTETVFLESIIDAVVDISNVEFKIKSLGDWYRLKIKQK